MSKTQLTIRKLQDAEKIFFDRIDSAKATYETERAEVQAKYDKTYELVLAEYHKKQDKIEAEN